jgi:hypothetical protein
MTFLKQFKWINTIAAAALTIGFSLMSTLTTTTMAANITGFQIISGIGGGILFPGRLMAVQALQKGEDVAIATALVSFFTSFGQSFGVAIGGAVFQNRWDMEVAKRVSQGGIAPEFLISSKNAEQTAAIIKAFPENVREVYRVVMASTVSVIWIVVASFAGLAVLASLGMRDISLEKNVKTTEKIDSGVESLDESASGAV